jgi:hypothetical protein
MTCSASLYRFHWYETLLAKKKKGLISSPWRAEFVSNDEKCVGFSRDENRVDVFQVMRSISVFSGTKRQVTGVFLVMRSVLVFSGTKREVAAVYQVMRSVLVFSGTKREVAAVYQVMRCVLVFSGTKREVCWCFQGQSEKWLVFTK